MIIKNVININKLNFYYFIDKKIFYNNLKNYNIIINPKLNIYNMVFLSYSKTFKYSWITSVSVFIRYFEVKGITNFKLSCNNLFNSRMDRIKSVINMKKKTTMLKKSEDYEYTILNKFNSKRSDFINKFKDSFFLDNIKPKGSHFYKYLFAKKLYTTADYFTFKNLDFKRKPILIFKKNRVLLRKFLKVKHKRQHSFNKYIKNFIKLDQRSFFFNFDFNVVQILLKSHFFFNKKDCVWFIDNGFVSLNGFVIYNKKKVIKSSDVLNIGGGNSFYFYYNSILNKGINNIYKYKLKLWKINKIRSNPEEKEKKQIEKYSNWIYNYMYFNDDIPIYLEVDFISMNIIVLNIPIKPYSLDYYNSKFLNVYLSRLYNWKFII